ncbi:MAG: SoxR reducing system RseC family protein [Deltaproteobacteria bacterium]|nr:SoxR reducing system RseC family protein [Deltaproteobacteria bacterium]
MLEEEGKVVKLEGGYAIIHTERGSSCDGCSAKSSCHTMSDSGGRLMEMRAINSVGAQVGDRVKVAIDSIVLLKSSFLVYVLPLIVMIAGGLLGDNYARNNMPASDPDLVAGAVGIACLVLSFLLIRLWNKSLEKKKEYQPQVIRIIGC